MDNSEVEREKNSWHTMNLKFPRLQEAKRKRKAELIEKRKAVPTEK